MPTTNTGQLAQDSGARYMGGPWDTVSNKGLAFRARNPDVGAGVADIGALLIDASGNVLVPAPAALSDSVANPTTTQIGSALLLYNGTSWGRGRSVASNADPGAVPVQAVHGILAHPATPGFNREYDAASVTDANDGAHSAAHMPMIYNGTTWDRQRSNTVQTVLASSARTATTLSGVLPTYNARIAMVLLNVTVASGTGGVFVRFWWNSPTGNVQLNSNSTPQTVANTYVFILGTPASAALGHAANVIQACNVPLPNSIVVQVTHGDASSYTYSVSMCLLN